MPYVEAKTVIEGDIDEIYEIIKDMQSYPKFMHDLVSVEIMERGENYTVSHWVSNVDGRRIVWTERDTFYEGDKRIAYQQIKGDLKKMEGQWSLKQMEDGVEVLLTVDFEFGIPMIAGLLNPLLKKKVRENSENMLSAVKSQIEMHR
jgi:ribosome-associated toxin RatA of RatAB toxin-antitoxin module